MSDLSARQSEPEGYRSKTASPLGAQTRASPITPRRRLIALILALLSLLAPVIVQAADERRFDIGIIIDNRPLPRTDAAKADVDALFKMLDQQMYFEHIMIFERPTIEVICDLFGCPETIEPQNSFPPLIWQITREDQARIFVYYIGDGQLEGAARQLLFARDDRGGNVVTFPVDWLHAMLEEAGPDSAVLMLDASFGPRPLPCAGDDPVLINDALLRDRTDYQRVAGDRWRRTDNIELAATTSVEPRLCDRFDHMLEGIERPLFTKFLLAGIVDGEADLEPFGDDDGLIDLGELTDYLDDNLERAARFQWGRLQNVRAVGPRSRVLASVDRRALSPENEDVLARRHRPPEQVEEEEKGEEAALDQPDDSEKLAQAEPNDLAARCAEDDTAEACHPCLLAPNSLACAERCQEGDGSNLCAQHLASSTDDSTDGEASTPTTPVDLNVVRQEEEQAPEEPQEPQEPTAACRWTTEHIAPYAAAVVRRIRGDITPSCAWATDQSPVELGPIAQIFTPIAWRLARSSTQDAIFCLLDCEHLAKPDETSRDERFGAALQTVHADERQALVDPRTLGGFNRHLCDRLDEPLPPYIGIPRWMPGTLILSEALRAGYDCPPLPPEPVLSVPEVIAIEVPAGETSPGGSLAVATADDRLAQWPPHAAGVDLQPAADQTPIDETAPNIQTADATAVPEGDRQEQPATPPEPPFVETTEKIRWLQSALTVDNRDPGPIDGMMGGKTVEAIRSWRRDNDRAEQTGALIETEFQAIIRAFGERFGQVKAEQHAF